MYGLLLEGLRHYFTSHHSVALWNTVLAKSGCDIKQFEIKKVYDEDLLPKLFHTASKVLQIPEDKIKMDMGRLFVDFVSSKGYHNLLSVLGRSLRDFLNGLDNLHEFLRSSYPHIMPPSFFCVNESRTGITLEYRSRREGFVPFFIGWMEDLAEKIYDTQVRITIVGEVEHGMTNGTILRLHFDNQAYQTGTGSRLLPTSVFFEAFPFSLVFNRGLIIINAGQSLQRAFPTILGKRVDAVFKLARPLINLDWEGVMLHTNSIFELVSLKSKKSGKEAEDGDPEFADQNLFRLRGQMKFLEEWDALALLATPILRDVEDLFDLGLCLNELSMHDSSRDMVLAGEQQAAELKLALEQESEKSKRLEENLRKLDEEVKRTDELLYQMIPRAVAKRLRSGVAAVDTCETFEDVTLLLSDVVGFTTICGGLTPLEVVQLLNNLYGCFDGLAEKHKVYKVETVGDAYLIASGCPVRTQLHAPIMAEMGIDMIQSANSIKDESKDPPEGIKIRVGLHTGTAVAGVVGVKMPRYCLFGSSVATVELMEQTSSPLRAQISEATRNKLIEYNVYDIEPKGSVKTKDGTIIETYWLNGKLEGVDSTELNKLMENERERLADSNLSSNQTKVGEGWESLSASRCSSSRPYMAIASARNSESRRSGQSSLSVVRDLSNNDMQPRR
ncbi:guanylate cyclase soluble subunit beta [Clonorchis sinensis]|uniref:guanylate cyclase n=1 Tax=Clonorchis sinensis TaxID=79923 RepID=G7YQF8_CLOSI|nr:guanylate cyclase soluble subunit beta [Clonorchis sinensis]